MNILSSASNPLPFGDILPDEPFKFCLEVLGTNPPRRCGKTLKQKSDGKMAREIWGKIQLLSTNQEPLLHLLTSFARVALCKSHHRKNSDRAAALWHIDPTRMTVPTQLSESQGSRFPIREGTPREPVSLPKPQDSTGTRYLPREFRDTPNPSTLSALPRDFELYNPMLSTDRSSLNLSLLSLLNRSLSKSGLLHGYIYIFSRACNPGLIKIGFSRYDPASRVGKWGSSCCYTPKLEYSSVLIPNAFRIEQLVQKELEAQRLREAVCKWSSTCVTRHKEWFMVSIEKGKEVAERWADWANQHRPWGSGNAMEKDWADLLNEYREALRDGHGHERMWENWAKKQKPMPLKASTPAVIASVIQQAINVVVNVRAEPLTPSRQSSSSRFLAQSPPITPPALMTDTEDSDADLDVDDVYHRPSSPSTPAPAFPFPSLPLTVPGPPQPGPTITSRAAPVAHLPTNMPPKRVRIGRARIRLSCPRAWDDQVGNVVGYCSE